MFFEKIFILLKNVGADDPVSLITIRPVLGVIIIIVIIVGVLLIAVVVVGTVRLRFVACGEAGTEGYLRTRVVVLVLGLGWVSI